VPEDIKDNTLEVAMALACPVNIVDQIKSRDVNGQEEEE
jgi:hypothetical protein